MGVTQCEGPSFQFPLPQTKQKTKTRKVSSPMGGTHTLALLQRMSS